MLMIRKSLGILLAVMVVVSLLVVGCDAGTEKEGEGSDPIRVALVVNGTLGDLGFFDSANAGVVKAGQDFGLEVKTIEATYDTNKWEPALVDAANGPYDVIIAGTFNMKEIMENIAPQFPDKQFILFDVSADFTKPDIGNIFSIVYKYNECGYLAGALAAEMTSADMSRSNDKKVVGFVGGEDIPVIQNFLVGYEKGIKDTDPEVKLLTAFAGDFNDPVKGKQLTANMIDNGADVVWAVAGATGLGVFEAALEKGIYAIAVNENQVDALLPNDSGYAETIAGAAMANVGQSLYVALDSYVKKTMVSGQNVAYGLTEGVVELEDNEYYRSIVPESIRNKLKDLMKEIGEGKIEIPSVSS